MNDKFTEWQRWLDKTTEGLEPSKRAQARAELEKSLIKFLRRRSNDALQDLKSVETLYDQLLAVTHSLSQGKIPNLEDMAADPGDDYLEPAKLIHYFDLLTWICVATRWLCSDAIKRVSGEIHTHYADGLHDAMERGQTELEAYASVMTELGDPKKANKAFRKTYLTMREEMLLGTPGSRNMSAYSPVLFFTIMLAMSAIRKGIPISILCVGASMGIFCYIILVWQSARMLRRKHIGLSLILRYVASCISLGVLTSYGNLLWPGIGGLFVAFFLLVGLVFLALVYARIYRKADGNSLVVFVRPGKT